MIELVDHFRDAAGNEVTLFPSTDVDNHLFLTAEDVRLNKTEARRLAEALLRFVESQQTIIETVPEQSYGVVYDADLDAIEIKRAKTLVIVAAPINDEDNNPTGANLTTSLNPEDAEEFAKLLLAAAADAKKTESGEITSHDFFD